MSDSRRREIPLPSGSIPVGSAVTRDGRPVVIVLLPTGFLVPLIKQ
jgi:hypothetical protein